MLTMERDYWLGRQRASFMLAGSATSAEDRLIHYHSAGLHSVKAVRSAGKAVSAAKTHIALVADATVPRPSPSAIADERYYRELAQGAAYLASQAQSAAEAAEHDRMSANYASRARDAIWGESPRS
jgi:hypothetical protein